MIYGFGLAAVIYAVFAGRSEEASQRDGAEWALDGGLRPSDDDANPYARTSR